MSVNNLRLAMHRSGPRLSTSLKTAMAETTMYTVKKVNSSPRQYAVGKP